MMTSCIVMATILLTACNDPNVAQTAKNLNLDQFGEIGGNLVANSVKNECENQINNQQGVVDLVLTTEQKANICGCVSEELKDELTADKLQNIIKDGKIDTNVLTGVVTKAMATCTSPERLNVPKHEPGEQTNHSNSEKSS